MSYSCLGTRSSLTRTELGDLHEGERYGLDCLTALYIAKAAKSQTLEPKAYTHNRKLR